MAEVRFEVRHEIAAPARQVWDELVDWKGHERWVPATRVEVDPGDPTDVGATFTAWTGWGKAALPDRMRVERCEWEHAPGSTDRAHGRGVCDVAKLGPVLTGTAGFTVTPVGDDQAVVDWYEDVTVPYVPQFLSGLVARLGAAGFRHGLRRLGRQLA